ncbi:hypothetical protein TrST_g10637 [Triparma strigata]|uniref:ATP synthase mitochondrial F1 complex assembly factor 2 n=1 Tax=Triparma strigata TaxID=1606541 RepID=A0A9W7EH36_9STRA|nr:hypothetical protein TrST_g10637 [Triparma strigata]
MLLKNFTRGLVRLSASPRPSPVSALRLFSSNPPDVNTARVEEVREAAHARLQGRKKFYKETGVKVLERIEPDAVDSPISSGVDGGSGGTRVGKSSPPESALPEKLYTVTLDGRAIKSPAKNPLAVPSLPLALTIANEWDYQVDYIEPDSMPLMKIASTAIDQVNAEPEYVRENCLRYLRNDTVCYWATDSEDDRLLKKNQEEKWKKLHEWIESEEGLGHKPAFTTGLTFFGGLPHPPELVEEAEARLERMDVWELTMMQSVTMEAKSFFIGLAVVEGALTAEEAIDASRVEEEFQIEQWGLVEGGHDMDQLNNGIQIRASVVFKDMLEAGVEGGEGGDDDNAGGGGG